MDRAGLRRKLLKAQAEAGDIVLLFGDESEALTHPYLAHVWAKKGADLRIPAPGQSAKVAMLGVLDWAQRELIVRTSRTKRSSDFIALLEEVDRRYGPKLSVAIQPIVLVLDNGPIHTSKASRAALAERAHWLRVEWLPKYAPELLGSRVLPHSTGPDAGRSPAAPRGASPPGRRWHSRHGRREWGSRTAPPGRRLRQRR